MPMSMAVPRRTVTRTAGARFQKRLALLIAQGAVAVRIGLGVTLEHLLGRRRDHLARPMTSTVARPARAAPVPVTPHPENLRLVFREHPVAVQIRLRMMLEDHRAASRHEGLELLVGQHAVAVRIRLRMARDNPSPYPRHVRFGQRLQLRLAEFAVTVGVRLRGQRDQTLENSCTVRRGERTLPLTSREYALLELLALRAGQVVTRTEICEHVYDFDGEPDSNVIDVYVGHLRKHLEQGGRPRLIHTRRGIGYVLAEAP